MVESMTSARSGIDQFDDVLLEEEDIRFVPAPVLLELSDDERAQVVEHLKPYEESRRAAKARGGSTLYQ